MNADPDARSLLDYTMFTVKETTELISNDFDFFAVGEGGRQIGKISTVGPKAVRFVAGSREFDLIDADGTPLLHISDPVGVGPDKYRFTLPNGERLATATKKLSLLNIKLKVEMASGLLLEVDADSLASQFEIRAPETVAAWIRRTTRALGSSLAENSAYSVSIDPQAPPEVRLAVIGTLLVIDRVHQKAEDRSDD